jgi:medium-chain acyl-[acyl-carrier-protein] hydrolase
MPFRRPNPAARVRFACLPFAGGGASAYRIWSDQLPLSIEVCAVQPPGRETRFRDPLLTRLRPYVTGLSDALELLPELPLALFGHSMGALVAFEVAREIRRRGRPKPAHLFVSGRAAPDVTPRAKPMHTLSDADFRAELRNLQGTSPAILDNDELMQVLLPVLRADFAAHETYRFAEEPPLDCPIFAAAGAEDSLAPPAYLEGWRRHTRATFESKVFPGNHFFLMTHRRELLAHIGRTLEGVG